MATVGDYKIIKNIGKGGCSTVVLAEDIEGAYCVLKLMDPLKNLDMGNGSLVENEIENMRMIDHPNIIKLLDYNSSAESMNSKGDTMLMSYLALELAGRGSLFDLISLTGPLSERIARFYFRQLCEALEYLHSQGISHRDIKLENILLDEDLNLKLADFGFSTTVIYNIDKLGTPGYVAPEIQYQNGYIGPCVDVFDAGVILFAMVCGCMPFGSASATDHYYKHILYNFSLRFWLLHLKSKPNSNYTKEFTHLLTLMFSADPINRPSITEVMAHSWCNQDLPTEEEIKNEIEARKQKLPLNCIESSIPLPKASPKPSVFTGHIKRSTTGEIVDNFEVDLFKREPAFYNADEGFSFSYTKFFSVSPLKDLFNTLACFVEKLSTDYHFSSEDYSVELDVLQEDTKISLSISILKFKEQDKYCIEAVKHTGDIFAYNRIFISLKEFFGGHLNATEGD